ncbi:MAG: Acetyl xylan esterase (AXE1)/PhoPQ-activated pathogenicity-related protein [Verrucomicrobiales bacterium]|nr:Acetyl xylan esterase (AXE1)/PhoPQ-activated pathogenicity-related protein [Verrucomicrobiales bacterium]
MAPAQEAPAQEQKQQPPQPEPAAPLTAAMLWDVPRLLGAPPASTRGTVQRLTQQVWYEGEPLKGNPTRVFAWLGLPDAAKTPGPWPAVLLVHGGGGKAFQEWAQHWAERGYAALAMDTSGQGPDGQRHADAGPNQDDGTKFTNFTDAAARDTWTYHAVAAVLRGHALLASLPEVDAGRVGITGISWGGYLTCLTAGLDPKLKVAVPVYGCGFLGDNSYWRDRTLAAMTEDGRSRWLRLLDPSQTLPNAVCPVLFLNGTHDFAYPPDSYRKTFRLIPEERRTLSVQVDLPHGHIWTFREVDAFIDSVLRPGSGSGSPPLTRLGEMSVGGRRVSAAVLSGPAPASAALHVTTDTGRWQTRAWRTLPATVTGSTLTAALPEEQLLTFFLTATDSRGLVTSTPFLESPGTAENTACIPRSRLEQDFYDWDQRHAAVLRLIRTEKPELVFIGDSITHFWGGQPHEPNRGRGQEFWDALRAGRSALNLGFGWDRTQNVLWRIGHGELDGLSPKTIVILIGTNNLAGTENARKNTPAEIAEGIEAVMLQAKFKCPSAKIILMGVLPRGGSASDPARAEITAINALLPDMAKAAGAVFLDIGPQFLDAAGHIPADLMPDSLHPSAKGYQLWADAVRPLMGG